MARDVLNDSLEQRLGLYTAGNSRFSKGSDARRNGGGRPKGREKFVVNTVHDLKLVVSDLEDAKRNDPTCTNVDGWTALVRRIWTIAMTGDDKDAVAAAKLLLPYKAGHPKEQPTDEYDETREMAAGLTDEQLVTAYRGALLRQVETTFGSQAALALMGAAPPTTEEKP
jgi:hypothetical protein